MAYAGFAAPGGAVYEIANPRLPYTGPIRGNLIHGSMIFVRGHLHNPCSRLTINLQSSSGDIALHLSIRFNEGCIVRNTCINGGWGGEERHGGMPLQQGGQLECIILVQEGHYKVAINGQHFTDYNHRIPKEAVNQLKVEGDLQLNNITFQGVPTSPFEVDLPESFMKHKNHIEIKGIPKDGAERFTVNLECDHDGHDIAFHFDARVNVGSDSRVLVGNNCVGGGWCDEERSHDFPFEIGQPFTLKMKFGKNAYKVSVDGHKVMSFPYRVDMECVHSLRVVGDMILESVKVH